MKFYKLHLTIAFLFIWIFNYPLPAQSWDFVKEKDGIKLYTKEEPGEKLKSFRGIVDINAPAGKVFAIIEDVNNTDWWDRNVTGIKILLYEKNKRARYYLVYDLPWPVTDRDLCVDVRVDIDTLTGERRITALPLTGIIPEKNGIVRITNYNQTWTIIPKGKEMSHVVLEGFVDPGGSVPDWIYNMLIIDSPYRSIKGLLDRINRKD